MTFLDLAFCNLGLLIWFCQNIWTQGSEKIYELWRGPTDVPVQVPVGDRVYCNDFGSVVLEATSLAYSCTGSLCRGYLFLEPFRIHLGPNRRCIVPRMLAFVSIRRRSAAPDGSARRRINQTCAAWGLWFHHGPECFQNLSEFFCPLTAVAYSRNTPNFEELAAKTQDESKHFLQPTNDHGRYLNRKQICLSN